MDFSWGEPYCVREALKHYYKRKMVNPINIDNLGYCPDPGNEKLIEYTRQFIAGTTGINYKYIIITNGTTGALNVVLRTLKKEGRDTCFTHEYFFPYYPDIIQKNNYEHRTGLYRNHETDLAYNNRIAIVDSPSNPEGDLLMYSDTHNGIIWDSVYHNHVFINTIPVKPEHRVNCGSYSKVFGLTGVRVGWIATNSKADYEEFLAENLYENCTMSVNSQSFILDVMENTDLNNFMLSGRYRVNNNREAWAKIEYLFEGQPVPENGMFYSAWAVPYTQNMFEKLGIKYVELDSDGNNKFLRFNLAQTNKLTNEAIRYIIKEDGI